MHWRVHQAARSVGCLVGNPRRSNQGFKSSVLGTGVEINFGAFCGKRKGQKSSTETWSSDSDTISAMNTLPKSCSMWKSTHFCTVPCCCSIKSRLDGSNRMERVTFGSLPFGGLPRLGFAFVIFQTPCEGNLILFFVARKLWPLQGRGRAAFSATGRVNTLENAFRLFAPIKNHFPKSGREPLRMQPQCHPKFE